MRLWTNAVYFNTADNILDVTLLFWMKHDFIAIFELEIF